MQKKYRFQNKCRFHGLCEGKVSPCGAGVLRSEDGKSNVTTILAKIIVDSTRESQITRILL